MTRAWCYASGLIGFGNRVPSGAMVIARGPEKDLRAFLSPGGRDGRA